MEIWRPVRILHDEPPWRDDREVYDRVSGLTVGRCGENSEDAGVRMVVKDAAEDAEASEIVFEGIICTMPGCDVEGGVILLACVETAGKFGDDCPGRWGASCDAVVDRSFEMSDWYLEISGICE